MNNKQNDRSLPSTLLNEGEVMILKCDTTLTDEQMNNVREQLEKYCNGLQRFILSQGITVETDDADTPIIVEDN